MTEPVWVLRETVEILHEETIFNEGGASGLRDEGLFESAVARPTNAWNYGVSDLHALAASCAFVLAKNHPFVDGNKRAAFLTSIVFLELNGVRFIATETDAALTFLSVAAGEMDEGAFADWLAVNTEAVSS